MPAELRIGVITPSSNTCLEPVATAMLRPLEGRVSIHFSRLRVERIGLGEDAREQFALQPMLEAAALLADAEVDVIAWGGTSGSWLGLARDRELCARIREATGTRATTSSLALFDAFRAFGVRRIGLAVPYTGDVTERIVDLYGREGVECVSQRHLDIAANVEFDRVPGPVVEDCVRVVAAPGADAVAVVCTNLRAAPLAGDLEQQLRTPVLDSVVATVWRTLDLCDPGLALTGWGALAASGSLRLRVQDVLEDLLRATGASRTTLRLDAPRRGLQVDLVTGEAVADGVPSMRRDSSLDQRAASTIRWLDEQRRALVQDDFSQEPRPLPALRETYGVRAQMLGPVIRDGAMPGWISVHQVDRERRWTGADQAALAHATGRVHEALDATGG